MKIVCLYLHISFEASSQPFLCMVSRLIFMSSYTNLFSFSEQSSIIRIVNALGITVDELLAGVQMNNPTAYQTDIDILMEDWLSF